MKRQHADDSAHPRAKVGHCQAPTTHNAPVIDRGVLLGASENVVEDLHRSYVPRWGGGIDRGDTSIECLKLLADVVNQPYWQRERALLALLAPFFPSGARPDSTSLRGIVALTFYDSTCVVEKRAQGAVAGLGERVVVGTEASVSTDPLAHRSTRRT